MIQNLQELYFSRLRDLYSLENQLSAALPGLSRQVSDQSLSRLIRARLERGVRQLARIERLCARHLISPKGEDCVAMGGLIDEAGRHAAGSVPGEVRDALILVSLLQFGQFEEAAYRVAEKFAASLDFGDDAGVLAESLAEKCCCQRAAADFAEVDFSDDSG
ncbi:ferritin-like domain-containing protein [Haloferula sargassicola]|uniref:Protein YciF n=1 Tax=Haloferula sargassicola TaxID=490096 RepID=A0ABP9UMY1_9BACT